MTGLTADFKVFVIACFCCCASCYTVWLMLLKLFPFDAANTGNCVNTPSATNMMDVPISLVLMSKCLPFVAFDISILQDSLDVWMPNIR